MQPQLIKEILQLYNQGQSLELIKAVTGCAMDVIEEVIRCYG